jgi:hypothetical protein
LTGRIPFAFALQQIEKQDVFVSGTSLPRPGFVKLATADIELHGLRAVHHETFDFRKRENPLPGTAVEDEAVGVEAQGAAVNRPRTLGTLAVAQPFPSVGKDGILARPVEKPA